MAAALVGSVTKSLGGMGRMSGMLAKSSGYLSKFGHSAMGFLKGTGKLVLPSIALGATGAFLGHYLQKKDRDDVREEQDLLKAIQYDEMTPAQKKEMAPTLNGIRDDVYGKGNRPGNRKGPRKRPKPVEEEYYDEDEFVDDRRY